jgi:phosphoenolpyruvate-protein kinase (PTS system EI component)
MSEHVLMGLPASPGRAAGPARLLRAPAEGGAPVPAAEREAELERARAALGAAGAELAALAGRLRAAGRAEEADIVDTGVLMAGDPALEGALEQAILGDGRAAPEALVAACELHAAAIAALGDELLAGRADDVRSLGRRAARLASDDDPVDDAAEGDAILVAGDLGPADVAELDGAVAGVLLAGGGPSAHAAVVARGLGIPMTVGLGATVLDVAAGAVVIVDGDAGTAMLDPGAERVLDAMTAQAQRASTRARERARRALPAVTRDGRTVRVLVNAATAAEARAGLDAGAEGAGLVRTELAFLDARDWPDEAAHRRALTPVLAALAGRTATVRVLDFGGDKTPPFLRGDARAGAAASRGAGASGDARGIALLLGAPAALDAQLRAIADAGRATQLRVLLPLVDDADTVRDCRARLERACAAVDAPVPALGAMVETVAAAHGADALAAAADFLSIGTNDLTAAALGADRFTPGVAVPHDPAVLALIAATVRAATAAGTFVEVCGEAASDPLLAPLLIGFCVAELSVGAARVGTVREWVRSLDARACEHAAAQALGLVDAAAVAALAGELLGQPGEAVGEGADGQRGVVALGTQP